MTSSAHVAISKVRCAHMCSTAERCNSFFYNRISKLCLLEWMVYVSPGGAVTSSGWRYFRLHSASCPKEDGYVIDTVSSTCYRVVTSPANFLDARAACNSKQDSLVVLDLVDKARFMTDFVNHNLDTLGAQTYYIGLSRPVGLWNTPFPASGPDYVWETGQTVNLTATQEFWGPNKPANSDNKDNVIRLSTSIGYKWDDTQEYHLRGYVCERPFV
ncbi:hypothetical protein V1264_003778 [Littorina saxatilis]|uniref:C-type lectin domain-containing protein n=1 Tax=Littorina saxatilis TaxID=31220 RepID=A0AAN9B111_9CAEN